MNKEIMEEFDKVDSDSKLQELQKKLEANFKSALDKAREEGRQEGRSMELDEIMISDGAKVIIQEERQRIIQLIKEMKVREGMVLRLDDLNNPIDAYNQALEKLKSKL